MTLEQINYWDENALPIPRDGIDGWELVEYDRGLGNHPSVFVYERKREDGTIEQVACTYNQ